MITMTFNADDKAEGMSVTQLRKALEEAERAGLDETNSTVSALVSVRKQRIQKLTFVEQHVAQAGGEPA